jgi:hypothetical protein
MCVLNKLHGKMFVTWSRLRMFICMMILSLFKCKHLCQKYFVLLFRVCPCVDMIVYVVMNNSVLYYSSQHKLLQYSRRNVIRL